MRPLDPAGHGSEWAYTLLGYTREELRAADAKAATLFGIVGTGLGVAVGAAVALAWTPATLPTVASVPGWLALAAAVGSVLLVGAALYPRLGRRKPGDEVLSFVDVVRSADAEALRARLDHSGDTYPLVCGELLEVSRIARSKYRLIRGSLWLLMGALALAAVCGGAVVGGS